MATLLSTHESIWADGSPGPHKNDATPWEHVAPASTDQWTAVPAVTTKAQVQPSALTTTPCPVCGAVDQHVVASRDELTTQLDLLRQFHLRRLNVAPEDQERALADRADFTQDYTTDIARCLGCGLILRNPRPSDRAISRAYRCDEYGSDRLEGLLASQLPYYRRKARHLARHGGAGPGSRVVEVGSFVGAFLQAGRELGWDIVGVDPGEEVTEFCRKRGLPVIRATLPQADLPDRHAQFVTIWNTFDQLTDPATTLEAARRILAPGGLLVLRVPDGEAFARAVRHWRRAGRRTGAAWFDWMAWNNLAGFPYLHGYSRATLDRLVRDHGLVPVEARPDVLPRLSDATTKWWAALEEKALKRGWRAWRKLLRTAGAEARGPWVEATYAVPLLASAAQREVVACSLEGR